VTDYAITFARSARRELQALESGLAGRILQKIEALATHPRPRGSRKIQGAQDLWRIRIGEYRVIYKVADAQHLIDVVAVRHRRDAYR